LSIKTKNNYRIIFFGTPDFAQPSLEKLINSGYLVIAVVTQVDKKVGRKQKIVYSPVKELALKYKIPVFQPEKISDPNYIQKIKNLNPDLIVVAAYGQILPKEILEIPKYGCINIHASLLPKYRGASPIHQAILNGDKEIGITIILMDEKMDHGKIIKSEKLKVQSNITLPELHDELAKMGAELLVEILPEWFSGQIKPKTQDESQATYTKILKKEDGQIDWHKSAEVIERQIRAFTPWPGSFCFWGNKRLKIVKAKVLNINKTEPGKVYEIDSKLAVQTGENMLELDKIQLEGKREMDVKEFSRGYPEFVGTKLK